MEMGGMANLLNRSCPFAKKASELMFFTKTLQSTQACLDKPPKSPNIQTKVFKTVDEEPSHFFSCTIVITCKVKSTRPTIVLPEYALLSSDMIFANTYDLYVFSCFF